MTQQLMNRETPKMEIEQFNPVRADVAALKKLNSDLVFIYDTKDGNRNARSHVYKLRQKKAEVERVRKDAKADAIERGRQVDKVAKEIDGELESMIAVHQVPLDKIEAEIQAKIAEAKRIEDEKIAEAARIEQEKRQAAIDAERAEAARVKAELDAVKQQQRDDEIRRLAAEQAKREAEEKAERERIATAKREQDARDAILAAERAKMQAEREAIEVERRAIADAKAAEQARIATAERAEKERIERERRAEQDRVAATEKARLDRIAAEAKAKADQESAVKAALAKQQEEERPQRMRSKNIRDGIIKDLVGQMAKLVPSADAGELKTLAVAMLNGDLCCIHVSSSGEISEKK